MIGRETFLPNQVCPLCGHKMDIAAAVGHNGVPRPGHFTVCINCASPLRFIDGLKLRPAWSKDMKDLDDNTRAMLDILMSSVRQIDRSKQ